MRARRDLVGRFEVGVGFNQDGCSSHLLPS